MQKIIIASHGYFSTGIEDSIKILIGERKNIEFIAAYREDIPDNKGLEKKLREIFENNREKVLVMFTDIKGGSITNTALSLLPEYSNLNIVSGMSLALVLEYILASEDEKECNYKEIIKSCINEAKDGMLYLNTLVEGGKENGEIL